MKKTAQVTELKAKNRELETEQLNFEPKFEQLEAKLEQLKLNNSKLKANIAELEEEAQSTRSLLKAQEKASKDAEIAQLEEFVAASQHGAALLMMKAIGLPSTAPQSVSMFIQIWHSSTLAAQVSKQANQTAQYNKLRIQHRAVCKKMGALEDGTRFKQLEADLLEARRLLHSQIK